MVIFSMSRRGRRVGKKSVCEDIVIDPTIITTTAIMLSIHSSTHLTPRIPLPKPSYHLPLSPYPPDLTPPPFFSPPPHSYQAFSSPPLSTPDPLLRNHVPRHFPRSAEYVLCELSFENGCVRCGGGEGEEGFYGLGGLVMNDGIDSQFGFLIAWVSCWIW